MNTDLVLSDPINWTESHIKDWLNSVQQEFHIPPVELTAFPRSGSSLCSLSQTDWTALAGDEAGSLLYKYLTCLREPFTGTKFVEPSTPLPSYRPRIKRPSSSSSCSTSSLATSALSPGASLSSSSSILSGSGKWSDDSPVFLYEEISLS